MKRLARTPKLSESEEQKAVLSLENKEVVEIVNDYNERYLHWEEVNRRKDKLPVKPEYIWHLMKFFRIMKSRSIVFGRYSLHYNILDDFQEKLHILDKGAAGNLASTIDAISDTREKYILNSLMEEAIASSQIEGATPSRRVAKEMLRENRRPRNKDERMIINNYNTMKYILKIKNEELTPELLLEIQKRMTYGTLDDKEDEGTFRDNNEIRVFDNDGEVLHVPPEHSEIPELVDALCDFANDRNNSFVHPIIKGILLHYLLNYIHPFNDGNGRTGRSLFYWYVLRKDYWLFEYMSVSRLIYQKRRQYKMVYQYAESDLMFDSDNGLGDLTYFIRFNLNTIMESLEHIQKYLKEKQKEQYLALKKLEESDNLNTRQLQIIQEFVKHPQKTINIKTIMSTYGVAYATARNDLFYLEKLGYLKKIKAGKEFIFIFNDSRKSDEENI
jgi:Fic family protein